MRTADYELQTPETKKHSEEHWCKSNVSEAGEGTAPSNEESKPTTENTETKQVLRLMEKFWFEEPPFTLGGVRANVQPKSSIPIGAKVEIKSAPRALH
jgi:hypothetical protein